MKKKRINAVYDDDLITFLRSIGEYSKLQRGKCHCFSCKTIVSEKNIAAIFPQSGSVKYICNNPKCLFNYSEKVRV